MFSTAPSSAPAFGPLPAFPIQCCVVKSAVSKQGRVVEDLAGCGNCLDARSGRSGRDPGNATVETGRRVVLSAQRDLLGILAC